MCKEIVINPTPISKKTWYIYDWRIIEEVYRELYSCVPKQSIFSTNKYKKWKLQIPQKAYNMICNLYINLLFLHFKLLIIFKTLTIKTVPEKCSIQIPADQSNWFSWVLVSSYKHSIHIYTTIGSYQQTLFFSSFTSDFQTTCTINLNVYFIFQVLKFKTH
jgi:hypothetical protein